MPKTAASPWWEEGALDAWRQAGDPLADAVVELLGEIDQRPAMKSSLGFVESLAADASLPMKQRRILKDFLTASSSLPEWLDWEAIARGQTFFVRFGMVHSTALLLGGLLESYSDTQTANVLMRTGRLKKNTYRRIFETGSMVYDAMIPDGLHSGRKGFRTLLKVRLMHAGVRRLMRRGKDWDLERFGVPICQEDLVFTLLLFDCGTLNGAQRLGLRVSSEQREDFHHLWRYVGFLMGVDEALLSETSGEADALYRAISKRQRGEPADGQALARSMIDSLAGRAPFFLPKAGIEALCLRLVGPELGRYFNLKSSLRWHLWFQSMTPVLRRLQHRAERSPLVATGIERIAIRWGEWALREGLGDEPARFPIPGISR